MSHKSTDGDFLYRYTSLPVLLDVLVKKHIVLLSPDTWEDRNDAHALQKYKETKNLKTLVAICFTETVETFHHWKVFSGNTAGACIVFQKGKLLKRVPEKDGFRSCKVEYKLISKVGVGERELDDLPFLKRHPFKDEKEFRVLFESKVDAVEKREVPITPDCIEKVRLSPWMPESLFSSCEAAIKRIDGWEGLTVERAFLLETKRWKDAIDRAVKAANSELPNPCQTSPTS